MNGKLIRSLIALIKSEEEHRETARKSLSAEAAYDQAIFHDAPLTNELYLLVLLFIWHEIEKEIMLLAGMSGVCDPSPFTRNEHRKEVERLCGLPFRKRRVEIEMRLPQIDRRSWDFLNVLRTLANCFKHDPFDKPDGRLLARLGIAENMNYATLSESGAIRFGLAEFLSLNPQAPFSEIVEAVQKSCDRILFMVRAGTPLRPFQQERVSLNPDTFEH